MVNSPVVVEELSSRASRELNLVDFPPLPKTIQPATVCVGAVPIAAAGVGTDVGGSPVAANPVVGTCIGTKDWNLADQSLPFFPNDVLTKDGRVVVKPSKEVLQDGAKQWENALLANFLGKLWGREGSVTIRFLAPSVYLINFPSGRVRDWVLESGPWHIQQKALILRKWLPGMMMEVLNLESAPVWVKLWHVPLELYSQKGLGCLASALEKPLYTDRATAWEKHLEFAKVCVDMAAIFVLPTFISMEVGDDSFIDVGVELAWSPPRCCSCAIFGHSEEKCPKKASIPTGMESIPVVETVTTDHVLVFDSIVDSAVVLASGAIDTIDIVDTGFNDIVVAAEVTGDVACLDKGNDSDDLKHFTVDDSTVVTGTGISYPNNVEGQELSPRKCRIAAGGVVDLLNQLKPKAKGKHKKKGARVLEKQTEVENLQKLMMFDPTSDVIHRERLAAMELRDLMKAEEKFYQQKSRAQFVKEGDKNSAYFFRKMSYLRKLWALRCLLRCNLV
ncbi:hypothetical protein V6N13_092901 [Hibiscus sabdariffa]